MNLMFSIIFGGSKEIFYVFFVVFRLVEVRNFAEKILEKIPGPGIFMLNILPMVFDQCVSCPSCPLPSTAKAQWPGNRVWCNQGIWISKKKYLETLASAFAAQQYCAAKRVAKKLKTFKKFAFVAGSCSPLCDTDCCDCYYYPPHMSPHIYQIS